MEPFSRDKAEPGRVARRGVRVTALLLGELVGAAMRAIGFAFQLYNRGTVHDSVQECHRQGRVAEVVGPGFEVDVRHQGGADALATCVDDLVPQTRSLRADSTFDAVEAE